MPQVQIPMNRVRDQIPTQVQIDSDEKIGLLLMLPENSPVLQEAKEYLDKLFSKTDENGICNSVYAIFGAQGARFTQETGNFNSLAIGLQPGSTHAIPGVNTIFGSSLGYLEKGEKG